MLEEPILGGKAVTASTDDLTPGRATTGRPHPRALRSGVIAAVIDGASYRQVAARDGVSTSVDGRSASDTREPMGGDRRSRLKGVREWLKAEGRARMASVACRRGRRPHLGSTAIGASHPLYPGRPHGAAEILEKSIIETGK